ncbi:MAG: flagellar assembly protein H [Candidatus Eremiobacteraeota bacterium]|nr:flagellar assembly protein H [Candidatus Eremiobacteraeota bacterium]
MMAVSHDRLFKELLTLFLYEFVELFLPTLADAIEPSSIDFFDKEMFTELGLGERREADLVARVQLADQPAHFLIHVEHQAQHVEDFARRMFRYWSILYERYGLPVYPIAVLSYSLVTRDVPDHYLVELPGFTPLRFEFRVIKLRTLDWRRYARRENPVAAALMARMRIKKRERPRVKLACLRLLAGLKLDAARTFYISHFVENYLRLSPQENEEFLTELIHIAPEEKEAVMRVTNSWHEQGLEQGREHLREVILAILERKFESVDAGLSSALSRVNEARRLVQLSVLAAETSSLDEFKAQLD